MYIMNPTVSNYTPTKPQCTTVGKQIFSVLFRPSGENSGRVEQDIVLTSLASFPPPPEQKHKSPVVYPRTLHTGFKAYSQAATKHLSLVLSLSLPQSSYCSRLNLTSSGKFSLGCQAAMSSVFRSQMCQLLVTGPEPQEHSLTLAHSEITSICFLWLLLVKRVVRLSRLHNTQSTQLTQELSITEATKASHLTKSS